MNALIPNHLLRLLAEKNRKPYYSYRKLEIQKRAYPVMHTAVNVLKII
uniref:Transposase n=1 Tax=Strongyloides papillosus TaxID=174720 RepID=A0A0N5CIQ4_STREA